MLRRAARTTSFALAAGLLFSGCTKEAQYPAPDAWPKNQGPGGPRKTFTDAELFQNCAFLDGGELDHTDHHNLVTMYDGYLLLPWAPEFSRGGLTFFDISDPCQPKTVGTGWAEDMRETHSVGFSSIGGRWAVTAQITDPQAGGILFWDVSDPKKPEPVSRLMLPGFFYPDAYARVTLAVFWQAPYVYVAGADNGIYVVDAKDPKNPRLVNQYAFEPTLRTFQLQVIGNLLFTSGGESPRVALLDVSDPARPQPIPGGDFLLQNTNGVPIEAYSSTFTNGFGFFARKSGGGGLVIYDLRNPTEPKYVNDNVHPGNGGYVFLQNDYAFVGESNHGVVYDLSNKLEIKELGRFALQGDLDTVTPIGNVAVVSVDDKAEKDKGSSIAPWKKEVDTTPPEVTFVYPPDGAKGIALTSRFGLTFSEWVDVKSAWAGSVRLMDAEGNRVNGFVSAQESIVNFWPEKPLAPNTTYTLEIPAGGINDFNSNAIVKPFKATFTTAGG